MADVKALLDQMERELNKPTAPPQMPGPLYHYTDAAGLLGILETRQIWATHYAHTNDKSELVAGEEIVNELAEELLLSAADDTPARWLLENFVKLHKDDGQSISQVADVYVASFTSEGNQLSQWRGYAADGLGYSLGLRRFRLPKEDREDAAQALALMECEYSEKTFRADVEATLKDVVAGFERYVSTYGVDVNSFNKLMLQSLSIALRKVAFLVPRFKNHHFSEEREWRLVVIPMRGHEASITRYRAGPTGVVPFIPVDLVDDDEVLPLSEVCVGPRQDPAASVKSLSGLLSSLGYAGADLARASGIPYRA